jgi:hypothetical protein
VQVQVAVVVLTYQIAAQAGLDLVAYKAVAVVVVIIQAVQEQ